MERPRWADEQIDWMLNSLEHWERAYGFNKEQQLAIGKLESAMANGKTGGLPGLPDRLGDYLANSTGTIHRDQTHRTAT